MMGETAEKRTHLPVIGASASDLTRRERGEDLGVAQGRVVARDEVVLSLMRRVRREAGPKLLGDFWSWSQSLRS